MEKANEYYDKLSNRYDELYGQEQRPKHERVLERIGNARFRVAVDVGCGTGELLSRFHGKATMAIGLDISRRMLEKAKQLTCENQELILGDAHHLPIKTGSTDCILSISVADEQSGEGIISEATRVARPGAKLIVSILHPGRSSPNSFWLDNRKDPPPARRCMLSDKETLYWWRK